MQHYSVSAEINGLQVRVLPGFTKTPIKTRLSAIRLREVCPSLLICQHRVNKTSEYRDDRPVLSAYPGISYKDAKSAL